MKPSITMRIYECYCLFILILILNCGLIFSQTTGYCGSFSPKDGNSCFDYSTNDTLCCNLMAYQNNYYNVFMCYPFSYTEYINSPKTIDFNGLHYTIDCGISLGTLCGTVDSPVSYLDCSQFSTLTNTCCYYSYQRKSNCVWLDTPSKGELEYNGLSIICSGYYIKIKIMLFIALVLFIL